MKDGSTEGVDRLFSTPRESVPPFRFDAAVARVFSDMIKRSVPGYGELIDMIGLYARRFVQPNSNCYDLGTSLGAVALAMRQNIIVEGCTIYAVDNSSDMLERCRQNIRWDQSRSRVEPVLCDLERMEIQNASMVVLNFTLQFVKSRQEVMNAVFKGLRPGGICIISEKLISKEDPLQEGILSELHNDFKRMNGYSDLEISQKRQSLENVLVPNSRVEIERMLTTAGFKQHFLWFRYFNFGSFFAQK